MSDGITDIGRDNSNARVQNELDEIITTKFFGTYASGKRYIEVNALPMVLEKLTEMSLMHGGYFSSDPTRVAYAICKAIFQPYPQCLEAYQALLKKED